MADAKAGSRNKWLIGCGSVIILGVVVIMAGIFYLKHYTNSMLESLRQVPAEYKDLLEKDDFRSPPDNVIAEEDLQVYIAICKEMKPKIEDLLLKENATIDWSSNKNYLGLMAKLYDLRKMHAQILKEKQFSIKKFKWITRQLVTIFGGEVVKQMNLTIRALQSDQAEINALKELRSIPQENLDLFNKYESEIEQIIQLWILGI